MENSSENKQEKKTWETPDVETIEIEDGTQATMMNAGPDNGTYS